MSSHRVVAAIVALTTSCASFPAEARFLQVDPVGYKDQANLYTYVNNDPANGKDPTGTDTVVESRYYIIGTAPVQGDYGHQYVWMRDTVTGATEIARAGPSNSDAIGVSVAVSNAASQNDDGSRNYIQASIRPAAQANETTRSNIATSPNRYVAGSRITLKSDLAAVDKQIQTFNSAVNDAQVPYYAQTQNSNSYANSAYQVITGVAPPTRTVLPGSGNDIRPQIPHCQSTPSACGK